MNLIVLLGAAIGSKKISRLLFDNPQKAATLLNLTLTETELRQIKQTFNKDNKERREKLDGLLSEIRDNFICPSHPCPYEVAISNGEAVPKTTAA